MPVKASDILLILVAIIFPPGAAAIVTGCSSDLLINILLTVLGYLPGHIHAFWLIYKQIKAEEYFGPGGYVYLGNGEFEGAQGGLVGQGQQGQQGGVVPQQAHYGSTR